MKKNVATVPEPQVPAPESPAPAAVSDAVAELQEKIAELERDLPKAIAAERDLAQEEQPLRARSEELRQSILEEETAIGALEQRLATGEDVSASIEASERKKKGLASLRNGVGSLLTTKEGERKAAGAEIGRLSELLASKRTVLEMGKVADATDAIDAEVYELSARLIRAIPERERLREILCERFREVGGIAIFNSRILAKRDARRLEAVKALRATNRIELNRFLAD